MSWDPEIDDPTTHPPRRSGNGGGSDAPGDDQAAATSPLLTPIDPDAPVSGHRPPPEPTIPAAEMPENDWSKAQSIVMPTLRPAGTPGLSFDAVAAADLGREGAPQRQPIIAAGPADLVVAFVLPSPGFDVIVTAEHLLAWGVGGQELAEAAMANLERWSVDAAWSVEEDEDGRRIVSSASGDGWDAARILVAGARERLRSDLGGGRILVGLPDRDLLVAARLTPGDAEFGALFATFVADQADAADDPIERRVLELVGDGLVAFGG
jgi:hypothetical protein